MSETTKDADDLGMKFSLDSVEKIVSHWMLQDFEIAEKIAKTPEWKAASNREGGLIARITVNGVELPFAAFDAFLMDVLQREDERRAKQYSDLDAEVERRLAKAIQDRADKIIQEMDKLYNNLRDASDILKPHWEK